MIRNIKQEAAQILKAAVKESNRWPKWVRECDCVLRKPKMRVLFSTGRIDGGKSYNSVNTK